MKVIKEMLAIDASEEIAILNREKAIELAFKYESENFNEFSDSELEEALEEFLQVDRVIIENKGEEQ